MPQATIDIGEPTKFDLESCEGAYVVVRPLSYGEWLGRQSRAMEMKISDGQRSGGATLKAMQEEVARYEFELAIVDHNLEDSSGRKLNFKDPLDFTRLHPRIGQEISARIQSMNSWEVSDQLKVNSEPALS